MRVRLLWIEGEDAADFADMIGAEGNLGPGERRLLTFRPDDSGHWLEMAARELPAPDAKGRLRVKTRLGNTFVFLPKTT